jgi:hypothetical protein
MKKLYSLFLILLVTSGLNAQWVVESFDHAVNPNNSISTNWADTSITNTNFYTDGPTSYMDLTNNADSYDGNGSMDIKYRVEAFDGWGGYNVRTNYHEVSDILASPNLDLSAGTELSLWYKVVTPADTSQAGNVICEFKLAQWGDDDQRSYFYYQPNFNFFDNSGQWLNVKLPLVQTDDKTIGFAYQGGESEDHVLHFDKIKGFEMAFVYGTSGGPDNTPVVTGEVLFDKLQLLGTRYEPLETFDNSASTWGLDWMDWAGADKGALAISDENTDFVEGTGSLKMDFTLSAPYDWGGFVAVDKEIPKNDSMNERRALVLYVKNLVAMAADSGRAFMRIFVFENSNGTDDESWIIDPNVDLSQTFDWTRCYLPLVAKPMGANDRFPAKDGFSQQNSNGDGTLNPEAIHKIRVEVFGRGTADGFAAPLKTDGSILVDVMQTSGFQFADFTAPAAPEVAVVQGTYSNLVTWTDVPGESGEKYNVYASENAITDLEADGVELIASNVLHGVQVVEHPIVAANVDKNKTYYYAITCKDFAGNIGEAGKSGAVTNLAKGIPTVSTSAPAFVADGDLSEWTAAGIKPFVMKPEDGSGHVVTNDKIDNNADLSADTYVAIDENYLYVAFDVTDDIVVHDPTLASYLNDSPDLFIGLYNFTKSHVAYQHGSRPDYHLRFGKFLARNDQDASACDSVLVAGTENYYWGEKFPSGYVVEARIPLVDLATKRNAGKTSIDTITWKPNYKIPFDIGINDNDGNSREGRMFYSSKDEDNGWQNVTVWAHTWIGDDQPVGVESNPLVENKYSLEQNYPNPFNPTTQIRYSISQAGVVKIKVFDVLGRQVSELVNKQQGVGSYSVDFNASSLSSGIYFYSIESGSFKAAKKMMLIK